MAVRFLSGIPVFLFLISVPGGFAASSFEDRGDTRTTGKHKLAVAPSPHTSSHKGLLAGSSLTALNGLEESTSRWREGEGGFPPPETASSISVSPKISQNSMQIPRKSRESTRAADDDDGSGKEKWSKHVIANFSNEHHPHQWTDEMKETGRHHHHHYHQKRSAISPPMLFLSILMDYSDDGSGSAANSTTKRLRAHRSFRTEESGQEENDDDSEMHHSQNSSSSGPGPGDGGGRSSSGHIPNATYDGASSSTGLELEGGRITSASSSSCDVGHFACTSNPSLCVPQSAICNGKNDCTDGSDEYKCVNVHEKKFWDSFFQKRPAADVEGDDARGNKTCLYKGSWRPEEEEEEMGTSEGQREESNFHDLLARGVCRCSLEKVLCHNVRLPNLHAFPQEIQFLDLSGCQVDEMDFPAGRFQHLTTLVLSSCSIRHISSETFSSLPSLKVLHLTGNQLRRLPASAFSENGNLSKLFLGHNQLETLDSESFHGLQSLEFLDLRKNRLTGEESKVFRSLESLRILHLSFNEIRHVSKDLLQGLHQLEMLSLTKNRISSIEAEALSHIPQLKHLYLSYNRLSSLENGMFCNLHNLLNLNLNDNGIVRIQPRAFQCLDSLQSLILEKNPFRELDEGDVSTPRKLFANLTNLQHIYFEEWWMCWWAPHVRSCEPKGDGISSVDNLLDNVILRVCVWIMGTVGVGGNLFVIISRLVIREKNRAHSFYIKNLAVADLLMGLFLMSIAFHDVSFRGHFLAHQQAWRHSITCQISGLLSTLSSEASVFILFLITLDRYLSIVRPFATERRNALIPAVLIVIVVWLLSILLSYAPLCPWFRGYFGKSFYASNGLCLPLHIHNPFEIGWEYSLFLFIIVNSIAFIFICYAYWKMLRIIQTSTTSIRSTQQKQDGMLVKRFGLVVVTDFLCWAPIILIKCIAMAGVEIQSDLYAWLAVFVLPVNSALNPIIYTLSTKLFKQQVSHITIGFRKRLGLATDDSTNSSLLYRNRISRTLQTSLNSSMMRSTRRYGDSSAPIGLSTGSTRVTVIKDRMASGRTSKVSTCSGNVSAVSSAVTTAISATATPALGHILPNGGGLCIVEEKGEINGQLVNRQEEQQFLSEGSGGEMMTVAESEL